MPLEQQELDDVFTLSVDFVDVVPEETVVIISEDPFTVPGIEYPSSSILQESFYMSVEEILADPAMQEWYASVAAIQEYLVTGDISLFEPWQQQSL